MHQQPLFSSEVLSSYGSAGLVSIDYKQRTCTACALAGTRKSVVCGEGNSDRPPVLFVGEAPGEQEDKQGRPFVGPSGRVLNRMIELLGLQRENCYITNVIGCRPPQNRRPDPTEVAACTTHLFRRIVVLRPRLIVALGVTAAQALLKTKTSLLLLRGRAHPFLAADGTSVRVICTYHPAAVLRAVGPTMRDAVLEDLDVIRKAMRGGLVPERAAAVSDPTTTTGGQF